MPHAADQELAGIALRLRRLSLVLTALSVGGAVAWWWWVDLRTVLGDSVVRLTLTPDMMLHMRLAGLALEMLPLAVQLWMIHLLRRFADEIAAARLFDTGLLYRRLGLAAMALGAVEIANGTLTRMLLTLIGDRHLLSVGLAMTAGDLYLMLAGAILVATAQVVTRAQAAQAEIDAFV